MGSPARSGCPESVTETPLSGYHQNTSPESIGSYPPRKDSQSSGPARILVNTTDTIDSKQVTALPISIKSDSGEW